MASKEYHRAYKQERKKTHKKITLEYPNAEYISIARRAKQAGRPGAVQIKAENRAYLAGEFLPPQLILDRLDEIIGLLRNIANNLNQIAHHSNQIRRLLSKKQLLKLLRQIETDVVKLIRSAWNPTE